MFFSQSTPVKSLSYCPCIYFPFLLFSVSCFAFLYSLGSFASSVFSVPLSPTFLNNTSLQFPTYPPRLFSSPQTQASQLISPLHPLFLGTVILAVLLLGCSSLLIVITFLVFLCFQVLLLSIRSHLCSFLLLAKSVRSSMKSLWFTFMSFSMSTALAFFKIFFNGTIHSTNFHPY